MLNVTLQNNARLSFIGLGILAGISAMGCAVQGNLGGTSTGGSSDTGSSSVSPGSTSGSKTGSGGSGSATSGVASTSGTGTVSGVGATTGSGPSGGSTSSGGTGTGGGPTLGNCTVFPADNAWNTNISQYPVHPNSDAIVDSIGRNTHAHPDFGSVYGIPYVVVPDAQSPVPMSFTYASESDPGPYPIPPNAPIEGSSDAHVLAITSGSCMLYELWQASPQNGGASWNAGSGAVWNLNIDATRPPGWTSADAAGLPVFPGLARYDEIVVNRQVNHALRFTVQNSRAAYIPPATHFASNNTSANLPAMGMRFRMKASFDCSAFSSEAQVMCTALKTYGMFMADNGSNWYISGAPDPSFNDDALGDVKLWTGDAFEVVYTGDAITQ